MVALSSDDSDTPKSRIPFATGKSGESRSVETSASSPSVRDWGRDSLAPGDLCEICPFHLRLWNIVIVRA